MPHQNSAWIMDSWIYGEGRTQIRLSSPITIDLKAQDQDRQGVYWYKSCKQYQDWSHNAIFIDRFPSQTKIGKDSCYFNNSLLCKPEFASATKTFLLKTQKSHYSASDWRENTKYSYKDVRTFSENS